VQGVVGHLHARERFVENGGGKGFASLGLNLLIQEFSGFGLVAVDPIGKVDIGADPVLDEIGMRFEVLCVDDEQSDDELSIGPKSALVKEEAAIALMNEARGPRFRGPGCVEVFFQEQGQLVRVCHGDDRDIATLVVGFHAMILEPVAESDILRVAELWRGYTLAVEVLRLVDAGVVAHNERGTATGRSCHDTKSFAVGPDVAVDRGVGSDVGHVDGAGKQGLDRCGSGIETGPLNFDLRSHGFVEKSVGFADHRLSMRDIGESADANGVGRRLGRDGNNSCDPE
jgi:hypothetical protein